LIEIINALLFVVQEEEAIMVIKQATEQDFAMAVFSRHSGCPVRAAMGLSWFCD